MRKLKNEDLNRATPEEFKLQKKIPVVVVLDNIRSLQNVGAIFRTADAFAFEAVYLCGFTGKPPHSDIRKAALGAENTVEWKYFDSTIAALHHLKKEKYQIVSIEQTDEKLLLQDFVKDIAQEKKYALVLGNEVTGIAEEVILESDYCIEIPQSGTKHSLNVSVCGGLVMWEFYKFFMLND